MSGSFAERVEVAPIVTEARREPRTIRPRRLASTIGWYALLTAIAVITVFPFFWMLSTSLKGPLDPISSVPPQFIPANPTLANYDTIVACLRPGETPKYPPVSVGAYRAERFAKTAS